MAIAEGQELALVTGAGRGIGAAIADDLCAAGYFVVGTATTTAGADAISASLGAAGCGVVLDVGDNEQVVAVLKDIATEHGPITVLVNNAGISKDNLLPRIKPDAWDEMLSVNLSSIYRTSQACLRGMLKQRRGRIINISSVVGLTGNAGQTSYAAAKAGVGGFTKSLAQEVGSRGITVNAIAPGYIQTDMTGALSEEQKAKITASIPLARLGSPQDISALVVFLVSDQASYITGQTLSVNGGMFMA